jgi:hypothetical protein
MAKVSTITPHRGKIDGPLPKIPEPIIDFFSRISSHHIAPGDEAPGPGWGVPEGHNIGNAPQPRVVGKHLDRSSRGKMKLLKDVSGRVIREVSQGKGSHTR